MVQSKGGGWVGARVKTEEGQTTSPILLNKLLILASVGKIGYVEGSGGGGRGGLEVLGSSTTRDVNSVTKLFAKEMLAALALDCLVPNRFHLLMSCFT